MAISLTPRARFRQQSIWRDWRAAAAQRVAKALDLDPKELQELIVKMLVKHLSSDFNADQVAELAKRSYGEAAGMTAEELQDKRCRTKDLRTHLVVNAYLGSKRFWKQPSR